MVVMTQITVKPNVPPNLHSGPTRPRLTSLARVLVAIAISAIGVLTLASPAHAQSTCLPHARCGAVTVPLDRTNPSAGTISVAYALVPRKDATRPALGTIVPNPGGPGQSTIGSAHIYLGALSSLRKRRDLLLIDPRGTGSSGPLSCPGLVDVVPGEFGVGQVAKVCGQDLGSKAGLYGSAAVADDFEAVRTKLGLKTLDLWGDSYGTFLMTVFAARHPEHVRSIVLDGAFPVASDPWGRDVLHGMRRVIGLVCKRSQRCSGNQVLSRIGRFADRLRRHPVKFTATGPSGQLAITLDERVLANLTFGGGDPAVYGLLPSAIDAALAGDFALIKRLATTSVVSDLGQLSIDPSLFSLASSFATSCHDYPRPYDLGRSPADRRLQYRTSLESLDPNSFSPFSGDAWLRTGIDAGPKCLDWPTDPTAGSPLEGLSMPDVPVLVQSGELDANTPIEQGRRAATQFAHPTFAVVANVGHTPDTHPCGVAMAIDFVKHLETDTDRCRQVGRPPVVIDRPAIHVAQLKGPKVRSNRRVRRVVRVAAATIRDASRAAEYTGAAGPVDALRGGRYILGNRRIRFVRARVVTGVVASGSQATKRGFALTRLRLQGHGVVSSKLTFRVARKKTRITGKVGFQRVDLRMPTGR